MSFRDYQKNRVYRWEQDLVPTKDQVHFENAQAIVNHIWSDMGLKFPPIVKPLAKQTRRFAGKANRQYIWLDTVTTTQIIIHELAHSMLKTVDGDKEFDQHVVGHGPEFVGMYIHLLNKYMNIQMPIILFTLNKHKVDFKLGQKPTIG